MSRKKILLLSFFVSTFFEFRCTDLPYKPQYIGLCGIPIDPYSAQGNPSRYIFNLQDSLLIKELEAEARWKVYVINSSDTPKFNFFKKTITFGELDFKLAGIIQKKDTIEFRYGAWYQDTIECIGAENDDYFFEGVGFIKQKPFKVIKNSLSISLLDNKKRIITSVDSLKIPHKSVNNQTDRTYKAYLRLLEHEQPEVTQYINKNKQHLNIWFLNESKRRGIIK